MTLDEIRERVRTTPQLQGTLAHDENVASIFEDEDGLETLLEVPGYYSHQAQDNIVKMFLQMNEDRTRLLQALDAAQEALDTTAAQFKATSERMCHQVMDRTGEREDAETLIRYASYAASWDAAALRLRTTAEAALAVTCDGSDSCKAAKHYHGCYSEGVPL
jgi:hypothetical protein